MSDTSQGAGWWLASDGKWYAPELAPHPPPPPQSHVSEISAQQTRPTTIQQAPTPSLPSSDMRATAASDPAPQQALVSDRSLGEGWWQASNGRWYAPEIYPSTTPRDGWWQGTSGKWWAPMFHPTNAPQGSVPTVSAATRTSNGSAPQQTLVSDRSMGGGWWQATDGKWYAPEVHPSDTPQGDGWWQATNGKWYAPMFYPTNAAQNGAAQNGAALTHQEANPGNTANTPLPVCAPPAASAPTLGSPQAAHGADYVETLTPFADSAKKKRSFRLHWRKMTWAIVIFNAIMLIWIIAGAASDTSPTCHNLSQQLCNDATNTGKGIAVFALVIVWLIGDVILGVLWLVTKGRSCPVCGRNVKRGLTVCTGCGTDFRAPGVVA